MNSLDWIRRSARSLIRLCVLLETAVEASSRWAILRRCGPFSLKRRAQWLHQSCLLALRRLQIGVHKEGDFPARGLLVSNHLSYIDILVFAGLHPCVFVSKKEVRSWPLLGLMTAMAGTIFLNRENRSDAKRIISDIQEAMASGLVVVLFPEGTSTDGSYVLPFHSALFEAAIFSQEPITPAHIGYQISSGSVAHDVCFWGSATFLPHLLRLLSRGAIWATVCFPAESRIYANRKIAAQMTREKVLELGGINMRSFVQAATTGWNGLGSVEVTENGVVDGVSGVCGISGGSAHDARLSSTSGEDFQGSSNQRY